MIICNLKKIIPYFLKLIKSKCNEKDNNSNGNAHCHGIIYDYTRQDGKYYIFATDPSSGSILWETNAHTGNGAANITITDNGDLIAFVNNDSLARIDPADGHLIWKSKVQSSSQEIVIDPEGLIYLYDQFSGMHRFNSQNGAETGQTLSVPGPICIDGSGKLYHAGGNKMDVYKKDGAKDWSFNCNMGTNSRSVAISRDNVVYVATTDKIYAIKGDASLSNSGWPAYAHDDRNTFNFNKH